MPRSNMPAGRHPNQTLRRLQRGSQVSLTRLLPFFQLAKVSRHQMMPQSQALHPLLSRPLLRRLPFHRFVLTRLLNRSRRMHSFTRLITSV